MTLPTKTMEVRFREKFLVEDLPPFEGMWWWKLKLNETAPHPQDVLAFIQSELSLSQNRILEEVEGMKKSEDKYSKRNNPQVLWSDVGYNQALKDIIKLISKKDN